MAPTSFGSGGCLLYCRRTHASPLFTEAGLIALTWSDVNFADKTVTLRNETTKNGKRRTLAFDQATRRALKVYRRRVDERELRRYRDLTSWHDRL